MGRNNIQKFVRRACKILRISHEGYTSHCWRRSALTNLEGAGVSFVNLKRRAKWASDAVVEGYIANSKPIREECEQYLLPLCLRDTEKTNDSELVAKKNCMSAHESDSDSEMSFINIIDPDLLLGENQKIKNNMVDFFQFDRNAVV